MNARENSPELPEELLIHILESIQSRADLSQASLSCRFFHDTIFMQRIANKAAYYVVMGQETLAKNIIETYAECLTKTVSITDHTGRKFRDVSIFQLALWALDTRYMCQTIIDCCTIIPSRHYLLDKLYQQYLALKENGICYEYQGQTYQEKYFDFAPIIQHLAEAHAQYSAINTEERTTRWIKVIGQDQGQLPIHALQHYCDPGILFHQPLNIDSKPILRTLWAYNWGREQDSNWYKHDTDRCKLGQEIAILKSYNGKLTIVDQFHNLHEYQGHAELDRKFFVKLSEIRQQDFIKIGKTLKLLTRNSYKKDYTYDTTTTMPKM